MKFEITKEKDNPLFKRKEIQAKLETDVTPSKSEVIKLISEKFSSPSENINIKGIHGTFGTKEFIVTANIYNSKEEKNMEKKKKKGAQPAPSETPEQEKTEKVEAEKKEEAQEQELAHPDKEPTEINKIEEKE